MADKLNREIVRKLDLLLKHAGIDDPGDTPPMPRLPRELTPQEQDAINNAPKAEATVPPAAQGPRVTAQNAPDMSSSVPRVPRAAVGSVTVETKEPDGDVTVKTMPADKAKSKR